MPDETPIDVYDIRAATKPVAQSARWVRIDTTAANRWAERVDLIGIQPAPRPQELRFFGQPAEVARWALLIDTLNFCFWTPDDEPDWIIEYEGKSWPRYAALEASWHRAIKADAKWLTPGRWAEATEAQLAEILAGQGTIPLLSERVRLLRETGRVLMERFDGEALHLLEQARFDAARIATLVAREFPGFRDIATYANREVPILKRAQIFASDVAAILAYNKGPTVENLEALTAFADYRLPQYLRHLGVMVLDESLERRIEAGEEIPAGSDEEIELRACTIRAVQDMVHGLCERRDAVYPTWMVDEYIWFHSHDPEVKLQHHRTRTTNY